MDADRLASLHVPVTQLNTDPGFGGECHLDANMVRSALPALPLHDIDLLIIENVGNLVCPAVYDLGQAANVVVLAVTEGEDKPLKYPVMFHKADLVLISKIDLLPHLPEISLERIVDSLEHVMPDPRYLAVSARTGAGIGEWIDWLGAQETRVAPSNYAEAGGRSHV
jgi:hydrogenase nickel incorporation protein HypB